MPSLASFNAFVKATGVKIATDPNRIVNDAVKHTYLIGRMLKGREASESVQSGTAIGDRVQLTDTGTAQYYHPNEDLDIQNVDSLVSIDVDWRFIADHYAYTEQEVTLNSGDPQTYYKSLLKSKRQACETSSFNKMEDQLWAAPSNSEMESSAGRQPYSIPAFVTSDGLAPSGFTTLETLNPSTNSGWRNQTETYNPADISSIADGLLKAMDRMWHKVRFVSPSGGPKEYFESDALQKMVLATNLDGITTLQSLTRDHNDRAVMNGNLGMTAGNITYAGIPMLYVSTLDTATINGGAAITSGQPWFFYLNLSYLKPIWHSEKYMKEEEPMRHPRQPFSWVVWKSSYYNLFCSSRKRQGLITPA